MAKAPKGKSKKKPIVKEKPPLTDTQKVEYFNKLQSTLEHYTPWLWDGSMWKTESQYWAWVRGQFRGIWSSKWAPKNDYLRKNAIQIPKLDANGNKQYYKTGSKKGKVVTVKGYECEVTGERVVANTPRGVPTLFNVDHREEAGALTNGFEACIYLFRLLCAQSNMQILSTEYHKVLTYANKHNLSIEEATAEKGVIAKLKKTVPKQKAELIKYGYSVDEVSNDGKRRECYREMLNNLK